MEVAVKLATPKSATQIVINLLPVINCVPIPNVAPEEADVLVVKTLPAVFAVIDIVAAAPAPLATADPIAPFDAISPSNLWAKVKALSPPTAVSVIMFPLIITLYLSPAVGVPVKLKLVTWKVFEIVPVVGVISGAEGAELLTETTIIPPLPVLVTVHVVAPLL